MTKEIYSGALSAEATESSLPLVPVSWGEVLDKLTILELKEAHLASAAALSNVRREKAALRRVVAMKLIVSEDLNYLVDRLRAINSSLWTIEDELRDHEIRQDFGAEFIRLARDVYFMNDERAAVKREINNITGSLLVEEKSYAARRVASLVSDKKLR